jgi:CheY-like chemotaxis protein
LGWGRDPEPDSLAFSGPSDNCLAFVGLLLNAVIDDILLGSAITEAASADNALDLAKDVKAFDICIIDFNMLGRNGLELYAALACVVDIEKKALLTANVQDAIRDEARVVRDIWQLIATPMIEFMDLGAEQGLESRGIVIQQLDWVDTFLEDGHDYFTGAAPVCVGSSPTISARSRLAAGADACAWRSTSA